MLRHVLFLIGFSVAVQAQQTSKIDSLQKLISVTDSISIKIKLYDQLTWAYYDSENDSMEYAGKQALFYAKKSKDTLQEVIALENIGFFYDAVKNQYEKALGNYQEAEKICVKNKLDYIKEIYNDIGVVYQLTDNYPKALEYYKKAYQEALRLNDKPMIKKCLANMASVSSSLGNYKQAELYFKECMSIIYTGFESTHQIALANLANLYNRQKKYKEALVILKKAIKFDREHNLQNCMGKALDLVFLLDIKTKLQDFSSYKTDVTKAEKCIEKLIPLREKSLLTHSLANFIAKKGFYREAFDLQTKYIKLYDSVKFLQRDNIIYELEEKYQTQKRKEEINQLQTENLKKEIDIERKNSLQRLIVAILLFSLIMLGVFVYFFLSKKKQANLLTEKNEIISDALKENEILLKETHHRVKNSLQMISSLLYLQSENISNKEAADSVKDGQIRVKSMALIHQKLYQKNNLTGVDVADYINDLATDVFQSHNVSKQAIKLTLEIEKMILDIDTITPLGIILNELIVNVLKHAFPKDFQNAQLHISLKKQTSTLHLTVKDNGIGITENNKDANSFGLKLIKSLARKLRADVQFINKNGTEVNIIIHQFNIH